MEKLAFMLIRPPSFTYNPKLIVPSGKFESIFTMEVHEIPFELTIYKQKKTRYIILYLHGNGSSRFEGFLHIRDLPQNVGLACFDFNGCGNRAEDNIYLTLGKNESNQVNIAAKYLKGLNYIVVGWGRSMGAVSLLLNDQIDIMISDSAYSQLS